MTSVEEKQARSVFVGNIPHGTTEEQMKEYFSDVGTVLSFRIVYDRETGNPKGYGFAEYLDTEMAQSAIRNLNGREFNGRVLRVDKASSQADELRMIHQQSGGPPVENPYGENVPTEKAPEAISRAVASLPPEQMFELMKQMKQCIQNNPNEARTMLLNNPQLAYALLQAQVVMKIVDPQVAYSILHRKPDQIAPLIQPSAQIQQNVLRPVAPMTTVLKQPTQQTVAAPSIQAIPLMQNPQMIRPPPINIQMQSQQVQQQSQPQINRPIYQETMMDPRFQTTTIQNRPIGSVNVALPQQNIALQPMAAPARPLLTPQMRPSVSQPQLSPSTQANQISPADQEKAALIMQVLQLKDEQIAMLPPEQRQSILILKEQIAQSAGGILPQI